MKTDLDCYLEANIICPYCYNLCEDDCCNVIQRSNGEYVDFQCETCGKDFKVLADMRVSYTSARLDENGEILETWQDTQAGDCKYGCSDCIWQNTETCDKCIDRDMWDDECK